MSQLATSGDDLKIWDIKTFQPVHQFAFPANQASGINCAIFSNCWSSDTSCVASIIKGKDKIVLNYSKNNKYASQEIVTQGITTPSYMRFPRTTQKDLMISSGPSIHIYDIAKSKIRKSFTLKSDITSFAVNHCDAYVAVGGADGIINLLTLATNQVSQPLRAPKCIGQKITSVKYSNVKTSFLGTSCESGVISFWDCNVNKNLFNLNPHCAPVTEVTFSPINDTLALSVGLDKKLVGCDTKTKKVIMTIHCDNPLTAVDFDMDGVSMAVGTSRGKILVYDLRKPKSPMKTFQAHNTSVSSLVYKHRVDEQQVAQVMNVVKPRQKLTHQKSAPSLKTVQEESKENTEPVAEELSYDKEIIETDGLKKEDFGNMGDNSVFSKEDSLFGSNNRRESLTSQLFSPLREDDASFTDSNAGSLMKEPRRGSQCSSGKESRRKSEVRLSSDGLFSPLREVNSPIGSLGSNQSSFNKKTPYTSFSTPTMSPLTSIREEVPCLAFESPAQPVSIGSRLKNHPEKLSLEKLNEFVKEASAGEKSPIFEKEYKSDPFTSKMSIGERDKLVQEDVEERSCPSIVKPRITISRSSPEDFQSVLTAFPDLGLEDPSSFSNTSKSSKPLTNVINTSSKDDSSGPSSFQKDFVSTAVSNAMEDWCEGVERRLWGLQYSMLRQLQQHQEETAALVSEFTGLGEMKEELVRLRKENQELRKFFSSDTEGERYRDN